jgi:FPC/CPF motif-containing protein YcgG
MHTYIKCVNLSRKKFDEINDDTCLRYTKLKGKDKVSFRMFQQGILFAYILGNLTAHKDREAIQIFFRAIEDNYVPKVKIIKEKDNVKICTTIISDRKICR